MKDKIYTIVAVLGILFLCTGSVLILANFSISMSDMMEPGFLTADKASLGVIATELIMLGVLIFAWLWKDII